MIEDKQTGSLQSSFYKSADQTKYEKAIKNPERIQGFLRFTPV
jgi:hypothetical protein